MPSSGYERIIFNLGLQEGWNEPECAFTYIDKNMSSLDQVTQIVGRVLRQPARSTVRLVEQRLSEGLAISNDAVFLQSRRIVLSGPATDIR